MAGKLRTLTNVAAKLDVGIPTMVEYLYSVGIQIDSNPNTKITAEQYEILRKQFDPNPEEVTIDYLENELSEYFNLNIKNTDLYAAGEVEYGQHGVEQINGEYYASLYHIQQNIAIGDLKQFLLSFIGSKMLKILGTSLSEEYKFADVKVKYRTQQFEIKKYPYSLVLDFYKNHEKGKTKTQFGRSLKDSKSEITRLDLVNFRRFHNLASISLGRINFLVGQNNSGKSTFVEGLRLMVSYLKQRAHNEIDLNKLDNNLVIQRTYGRINNFNNSTKDADTVCLGILFEDCEILVDFSGSPLDTKPKVEVFRILNPYFEMIVDFRNTYVEVQFVIRKQDSFSIDREKINSYIKNIESDLNELENLLNEDSSSYQGLTLFNRRNELQRQLKKAKSQVKIELESAPTGNLIFRFSPYDVPELSISNILNAIADLNDQLYRPEKYKPKRNSRERIGMEEMMNIKSELNSAEVGALRKEFDLRFATFEMYLENIFYKLNNTDLHFIEGASIKFNAVLKPNDNQDNLLRCIRYLKDHDVFTIKNHLTLKFIEKWIGKDGFDFGTEIRVNDIEGEVFTVEIKSEKWQFLSEFGLGAQRLFELIISIAQIIHQFQLVNDSTEPILLIEEPEAHIHPALQSKLAQFFYEINLEYNIRFIVETHSEYIIRKTQLIGKENNLFDSKESNPFNVIYFDKENGPYNMNYREDGKFVNSFGPGFFDVSSNLVFELL